MKIAIGICSVVATVVALSTYSFAGHYEVGTSSYKTVDAACNSQAAGKGNNRQDSHFDYDPPKDQTSHYQPTRLKTSTASFTWVGDDENDLPVQYKVNHGYTVTYDLSATRNGIAGSAGANGESSPSSNQTYRASVSGANGALLTNTQKDSYLGAEIDGNWNPGQ